ncbi:MAG: hypothetical protein MUP09_00395 [Thiovulaceae bacterium]|nr:hypothetical protein [Sulfurimonadaceae bacterium]
MRRLYTLLPVIFSLLFAGCGDTGTGQNSVSSKAQGWHFQGRDCLACHNIDMQGERHLLVAGTLFKSEYVNDQDDLSESCGGNLIVNFENTTTRTVTSSADYADSGSKGNNGKGNLFILQRLLRKLEGDYIIQITDSSGNELASSDHAHQFNGGAYSVGGAIDGANRRSCNACHQASDGTQIYVQSNTALCK